MAQVNLKQTSSYKKVIQIPDELRKFGDVLYKYVDSKVNTSWFSKVNEQALQNAKKQIKILNASDPYNICWQLERNNRFGYVLYLDRSLFLQASEICGGGVLILGITGEFRDTLLITLILQNFHYNEES